MKEVAPDSAPRVVASLRIFTYLRVFADLCVIARNQPSEGLFPFRFAQSRKEAQTTPTYVRRSLRKTAGLKPTRIGPPR